MNLNIINICERCKKLLANSFLHVHDKKANVDRLHTKCKFQLFHRRIVLFYRQRTFLQNCLQSLEEKFVFFGNEAFVQHDEVVVYHAIYGEVPVFTFFFPSVILINMDDEHFHRIDVFTDERFDTARLLQDIVKRRFCGNTNAVYNLLPIFLETLELQE